MYSNHSRYALSEGLPAGHWDGYCEACKAATIQIALLRVRRGEEGWNVYKATKM